MRLTYSRDEILADHPYATKLRRGDRVFHGGLLADGSYRPPRSLHRADAIQAWSARVQKEGGSLDVMGRDRVLAMFEFFPTREQAILLLRNGCQDALTRLLTMVGIVEGFGNDGIKLMPPLEIQQYFRESVEGTSLEHLHKGLFTAHGLDEAGSGAEAGHDEMWFAIRDAALDSPTVTQDMYEDLPIAPPPGYQGRAKAAPEALNVGDLAKLMFPTLDPKIEITLRGIAQVLLVEYGAYTTFNWARDVLSDPDASAAPVWAPQMVDYIQADEDLHVGYLQCALAEARMRTFIDQAGGSLPGAKVVDEICESTVRRQGGDRLDRMKRFRFKHILAELEKHPEGDRILDEFKRLGPVPTL